jgi:hypothetical protein
MGFNKSADALGFAEPQKRQLDLRLIKILQLIQDLGVEREAEYLSMNG